MAALANKKFVVEASDPSEPVSRASRRIVINAEILKQARVYAGDVIAVVSSESLKVSIQQP